MKKFLLVLLTLLMAFTLVGCGSEAAEETEAVEETETTEDGTYETLKDEIYARGKLIVGIEGTYPPYTYHGDDGELTGFDVELAYELADVLGLEVEFVESEWDSLLVAVDTGRVDTLINDVGLTEERKEKYTFAGPVLYHIQNIYVLNSTNDITCLEDLNGKKLATNITGSMVPYFEDLGVEIVGISTSEEAQQLLQRGECDFLSTYPIMMEDYWKEHPEARENTKIAFALTDKVTYEGIPFKKGYGDTMAEAMEEALEVLRQNGKLAELSEKWMYEDLTTDPSK